MNVVLVVAAASAVTGGLFALWCWVLGRIEERETRQATEATGRGEPPVLGGAHYRRPGGRR